MVHRDHVPPFSLPQLSGVLSLLYQKRKVIVIVSNIDQHLEFDILTIQLCVEIGKVDKLDAHKNPRQTKN